MIPTALTETPESLDERWLPVVGWEGIYEVSDLGRVKRTKRARGTRPGILKGGMDRYGYPVVALSSPDRPYRYVKIHRLVGDAFLGLLPEGMETRHLNGNPADPRLVNLAYGTHAENMRDMDAHGTSRRYQISDCPQGHPYDRANTYIDHRGARNCRRCLAARKRARERAVRNADRAAGQDYYYEVRRWGRDNGWAVKDTGRISNQLLNAYTAAHQIEARTQRAAA